MFHKKRKSLRKFLKKYWRETVSVLENKTFYVFLKNFPPLFPIPLSVRLNQRCDLVSGLHCNSTKFENKTESKGEISESFTFLQETTFRCSSSCQCRITNSRPDVVSNEHPSRYRSFTLLQSQQTINIQTSKHRRGRFFEFQTNQKSNRNN